MKSPFLPLCLSLIAGILFGYYFSISISIFLYLLIFILILSWVFYFLRKYKTCFIFILLTFIIFGCALQTFENNKFNENKLHNLKFPEYADFYGTLYKSPQKGIRNIHLYLKVKKVNYGNRDNKAKGNLRISARKSEILEDKLNLFVGDELRISAKPLPFTGYHNFNLPTIEKYLKIKKIHKRAYTKSLFLIQKIKSGSSLLIFRWFSLIKVKMQNQIEKFFYIKNSNYLSQEGAILEALLLGERGRINNHTKDSLQKAGIYHLLAISGAHIAIISYLFFLFFKMCRIPERISYFILIFILIGYAFLVESRVSVIRATVMAVAFLIGKLLWRDVNLINTVSFSAFFLLLINPFSLFDIGFQLTFLATLSIIIYAPKIISFLPHIPFKISELIGISITAQLGVLPIIAYYFNRITFSSIILNLIAVPLIGIIMGSGFVFLLISFISYHLGILLSQGIFLLIKFLLLISNYFNKISFISYRIPTPFLIVIISYYSLLGAFLLPKKFKGQKLITTILFLIFFTILIIYPFPSISKSLKVTFIDVGQGDSILVEFPGKKKMLIDGGGTFDNSFDIGERIVSPFLWSKGIKRVDYLVMTHAHPDHINGLISVSKNFRIGEVWESVSPSQDKHYKDFISSLPSDVRLLKLYRGVKRYIDGVLIQVLHPPKPEIEPDFVHNNQSLVIRIKYGENTFLFTGDIESLAEKEIINYFNEINSLVLKSPHHGSQTSSSEEFLSKVKPKYVVISVGAGNRFNFPDDEVLNRYKKFGIKIYRTDRDGAIEFTSNRERILIRKAVNN